MEKDRSEAKAALLRSKPYLITALASAGATLLNPYFYHLHVHMFVSW